MADKKVVVAGATGLVGNAALRHFSRAGGCGVVALSRRKPRELYGARHVEVDLTDPAQCTQAATALQNTTHLVYAALHEAPNLIDGWRDPDQIRTNDVMLRNLMAALDPVAPTLRHVVLLQRTKAARKCTSSQISIGLRRIFCANCSRARRGTGASSVRS